MVEDPIGLTLLGEQVLNECPYLAGVVPAATEFAVAQYAAQPPMEEHKASGQPAYACSQP